MKLPALSARVQAGVQKMSPRHDIGAALARPLESAVQTLVSESPPLTTVDPVPEHMLQVHGGEGRPMERPDATWDHLAVVTPQFFLRNTWRIRQYADPDDLLYGALPLRDPAWRADLEAAQKCHFARFEGSGALSSDLMVEQVAFRRRVVVDVRWTDTFGRPDPD